MAKHSGGRPVTVWTPATRAALLDEFLHYLYDKDEMGEEYANPVPSVSEFAFRKKMNRQRLYEFPEFVDALELCKSKRERDLEMGGLSGAFPPGMAIFGLKQLGWKDSPDEEERPDNILTIRFDDGHK